MEIEFDPAKDDANRAKHGLALAEAARLDWQRGVTLADDRADYGEPRYVRVADLGGRLHVCVFTLREGRLRIISLRKANSREIRGYGSGT